MSEQLRFVGKSDPGIVKHDNEDCCVTDAAHGVFIVADGMGGERGGDVASHMAIELIHEYLLAELEQRNETNELLTAAIRTANQSINDYAAGDKALKGMGTTVVVAVVTAASLHWAHVGDSRLYLFRAGVLTQVTEDHNLVRQLEKEGVITPGSDASLRYRNVLSKAVGTSKSVDPDTGIIQIESGDIVLLCTDGLTEMVTDETIGAVLLKQGADLEACSTSLIEQAKESGGRDNITVLLLSACSPLSQ